MILIKLPTSELKTILKKRKKDFDTYRIAKGKFSENTKDISETIDRLTKIELENSSKNKKVSNNKGHATSEDTTKATKTYTEKIKGGYFGKRRSRF